MRACAPVQVEEAVTVSAKVPTYVTQDDGCCLTIIVVVTHGLQTHDEEMNNYF